jgi:uncharacterized protein YwqG
MELPESLQPYQAQIELSSLPCVRFSLIEGAWPGRSRVGGQPDLPSAASWPKSDEGRPMEFILQVDLEEAGVPGFPQSGLLQFFYDLDACVWGGTPGDERHYRVLFHETGVSLAPVRSQAMAIDERAIAFAPAISLPPVDEIELPAELEDEYTSLAWTSDTVHQLGGHPMEIQNPVVDYLDHVEDGRNYRLLLQLDSEEPLGLLWGDVGRIFLMIHRDDLVAAKFDRVELNLQCY